MKPWLRRNRWAFAVMLLATVVIATTVTYPAWSRKTAAQHPQQTVALGEWADIDGVRWKMSEATIPPIDGPPTDSDEVPEHSRLVAYTFERERDGRPAGLPDGYRFCLTSMVDGPRRWTTRATSIQVLRFSYQHGMASTCDDDGPLLVAMYIPENADISAVDVLFQPGEMPPESEPGDIDENAPVFETFDESPTVVKFLTR